jgi:hypothetical protein
MRYGEVKPMMAYVPFKYGPATPELMARMRTSQMRAARAGTGVGVPRALAGTHAANQEEDLVAWDGANS